MTPSCVWKCEFGAWPKGRELEVIHQEVITAMDAIQEITALKLILIPYSFGSFKQKMASMLRNNPHIQSQNQHVAILQNQADPECPSGLCMPHLYFKHRHQRPVWTRKQGGRMTLHRSLL